MDGAEIAARNIRRDDPGGERRTQRPPDDRVLRFKACGDREKGEGRIIGWLLLAVKRLD